MEDKKKVAIVLAAGTGKRMQSDTPKQYLLLDGKPILYYSLKAFEESSVDEIILMVGANDVEYCRKEIVEQYHLKKVYHIVEGGTERYHSVYHGLKAITVADYILIHDGARPFITVDIIERTIEEVILHSACIVGVPSKDTIKIVNDDGIVIKTPNRDNVWTIQTPQAFSYTIIMQAYNRLMEQRSYTMHSQIEINTTVKANDKELNDKEFNTTLKVNNIQLTEQEKKELYITDDAMVVEHTLNYPIKLVMGNYSNIKVTTPEDILIGETLLRNRI